MRRGAGGAGGDGTASLDAVALRQRPGEPALSGELLRCLSRNLAARRLGHGRTGPVGRGGGTFGFNTQPHGRADGVRRHLRRCRAASPDRRQSGHRRRTAGQSIRHAAFRRPRRRGVRRRRTSDCHHDVDQTHALTWHVPDVIVPIAAVPRTLTGKKLEVPVKRHRRRDRAAAHRTGRQCHRPRRSRQDPARVCRQPPNSGWCTSCRSPVSPLTTMWQGRLHRRSGSGRVGNSPGAGILSRPSSEHWAPAPFCW